jgi:enamine deaminase RidA (YjgF/YER057c/UK114 family)
MSAQSRIRLRIPFSELWSMRIEHPYSLLVRADTLAWTSGQCPLTRDGAVLAPDDSRLQARYVADCISLLLDKTGFSQADVCKLVLYHAPADAAETEHMLNRFRPSFPGAILMPVGIPFFYYAGMRIEVDVHAAERCGPLTLSHHDDQGLRISAVNGGDLVWIGLEVRDASVGKQGHGSEAFTVDIVYDALRAIAGVSPKLLIADHWFVIGDGARPALERFQEAGLVTDVGAAVRATLPGGVVAMGELTFAGDGLGVSKCSDSSNSGISVFVRRSRKHFWIGARSVLPAASLVSETKAIMGSIAGTMREQGWSFDAVCKATTHYVGSSTAEDLHDNMKVRNVYYNRPGPASTGVPVAGFAFSSSRIAVDLLGVIE